MLYPHAPGKEGAAPRRARTRDTIRGNVCQTVKPRRANVGFGRRAIARRCGCMAGRTEVFCTPQLIGRRFPCDWTGIGGGAEEPLGGGLDRRIIGGGALIDIFARGRGRRRPRRWRSKQPWHGDGRTGPYSIIDGSRVLVPGTDREKPKRKHEFVLGSRALPHTATPARATRPEGRDEPLSPPSNFVVVRQPGGTRETPRPVVPGNWRATAKPTSA